jgi:hypothetical protein
VGGDLALCIVVTAGAVVFGGLCPGVAPRATHYEVVRWSTAGDGYRRLRWVARWPVMNSCGCIGVFGDTSGTRHHSSDHLVRRPGRTLRKRSRALRRSCAGRSALDRLRICHVAVKVAVRPFQPRRQSAAPHMGAARQGCVRKPPRLRSRRSKRVPAGLTTRRPGLVRSSKRSARWVAHFVD